MAGSGVNYIPRPDGTFNGWAAQFLYVVKDWWTIQGLKAEDLLPLEAAAEVWTTDYTVHVSAAAAAEAARQAKDAARAAFEAQIRPIARFVQSYPATTNADRASMGITVRDTGGTPVPQPTTRPLVRVDTSQRLLHTLRFSDESTPTRRRKPYGVLGAEVWIALEERREQGNKETKVESPANANGAGSSPCSLVSLSPCFQPLPGYRFLAVSTSGTLQADFSTAEAGRTAYYALRWLSTRGETGPWSEIASATVAA